MQYKKKLKQSNRKDLFIFILLLLSCNLFLSILIIAAWRLTELGLAQIHALLPKIVGLITIVSLFTMWSGIILFLVALFIKADIWYCDKIYTVVIHYFFPLMVIIGRFFRISEEKIQKALIEINNCFVQRKNISVKPDRIMILLPQCLQNNDCSIRITRDIRGCKRCGKCQITEIINLLDKYSISCWVATGGTLARKFISDYKPDVVIAIACARDLSSGIIDCFPIPVYGILNQRPEGPCVNTLVDINMIYSAICSLLMIGQDMDKNVSKA